MSASVEEALPDVATGSTSKGKAKATLGVEDQIRALSEAFADAEAKTRVKIEKLEAALAQEKEARSKIELADEEDKRPRNLVVCIDGTANQFGVKVSTQPGFASEISS